MQKYFLHILIAVSLVVVVCAVVSGYKFINLKELWYVPTNLEQNTEQKPGNLVGDELPVPTPSEDDGQVADPGTPTTPPATGGKLKADVFTGKLEEVHTGCFADGECYIVAGGKHVTTLRGWRRDTVGSVQGVEGFGDLENYIGKNVEVYAQVNPDNTYTLYGSEGFYVKLLDDNGVPVNPPKHTAGLGCVIGGCSGQVCFDAEYVAREGGATTCEWEASYACYKTATCEKQVTGQCGWTPTEELNQCLADAKSPDAIPVQ